MGTIILQFVGNESLGSELIEWFDRGVYSHVDSVLPDGSLLGARSDEVEGIPSGVQIRPATYVSKYQSIKRVFLHCPDEVAAEYYAFLHEQLGKPYDETAIVAFVMGRNWEEDDSWFCSELSTKGLMVCKYIPYQLIVGANKIPPDTELAILSALSDLTEQS